MYDKGEFSVNITKERKRRFNSNCQQNAHGCYVLPFFAQAPGVKNQFKCFERDTDNQLK